MEFEEITAVLLSHEGVPRVLPGVNSSTEYRYVTVSLFGIFRRLTGSGRFLGSGTVENDLLVFAEGRELRPEFREEHRAFKVKSLTFLVILICADEQRPAGGYFPPSLFRGNTNRLCHFLPPFSLS
jgi:hypothetical protein